MAICPFHDVKARQGPPIRLPVNFSSVHSLSSVFQQGFVVHDVAEPLVSFDDSTPAEKVRAFMSARRFEVLGIRKDGHVEGYADIADMGDGLCADYMKSFEEQQLIPDSMSLADLVLRLKDHPV